MLKHILAIALVLPAASPAAAAPPVRTLYQQAIEREQTARAAWTEPGPPAAAIKATRRAIASYESVVRNYPASGYCDDALWQAGRLALDAFGKFGETKDHETGVRLLRLLASEYPTSKFAKQVPATLTTAASGPAATPASSATLATQKPRDASKESVAPATAFLTAPATASPATATTKPPTATQPTPRTALPTTIPTTTSASATPARTATPPTTPASPKQATIMQIRRSVLPDVVRVTISLDTEVPFHDERIAGPERIFIDFPSTLPTASLVDRTLRYEIDRDVVRQVKVGRHPNSMSRVVLDADGVSSYSVYPLYNPYRLIVDCVRAAPAAAPNAPSVSGAAAVGPLRPPARPVAGAIERSTKPTPVVSAPPAAVVKIPTPMVSPLPSLSSRRIITTWGRTLPKVGPHGAAALDAAYDKTLAGRVTVNAVNTRLPRGVPFNTALIAAAVAPAEPDAPPPPVIAAAPPLVAPIGPPPNPFAGVSMARQLGLGVSRIVIDPGHGGHDPGAKGKGGITEAELVLDVSLRLQKLLEKVKGVEVILTRHTDEFIPLQERTAIANREGADLFLSVHANASPNDQARGIETYFLNFANNLSAASVAARENATSGQAMGALPDFVKAIALNNKLDESHDFATLVQESMVERLRLANASVKDLGVKQAPFVVLIGASMPSVLAEISFLTHEQEAKLLKSGTYRQHIAEALFNAVRKYQTSLQRVQTVALH